MPAPPAAELIAVAPRRHFGPLRRSDPDEIEAVTSSGHADVVGGHAKARLTEQALAFFDRLPSLLERRQVPSLAFPAYDPQPSARGIERQATPDRKLLDRLVGPEVGVTEDARRIHGALHGSQFRAV